MVIDASLTMAWYFDDKSTAAADELQVRVSETGAVVPACGTWRSRNCGHRSVLAGSTGGHCVRATTLGVA
jgi:hypothetical protein